MKVKELIEVLKSKNQEALVIIHMNGDLGPQALSADDITEDKMYADNYGSGELYIRYPEDVKKEANADTVGLRSIAI